MIIDDTQKRLITEVAKYYADPLGFANFAYPWGVAGTKLAHSRLENWQADELGEIGCAVQRGDETIKRSTVSGHGVGKGNPYKTTVYTPSGKQEWGNIYPGDMLLGSDGSPVRVVSRHELGMRAIYRVAFDDGSIVFVTEDHLWNVRGRQERRNNLDTWRTITTKDIIELGVKRPNGTAMTRTWEIPIQGAAQFEEREIDLHPYFVGLWLGDGKIGEPSYCKPYPEVSERLRGFGYDVVDRADGKTKYIKGIVDDFRQHDVFFCNSPDRYIPDDYKYNTIANRTELLRGLLDTDGEVHGHTGTIGYASTSERLLDDVVWLVRSLGGKATKQPTVKHGWYPDEDGDRVECRDCWRATINLTWNPFTIEHRKDAYKPSEARYTKRWVDSIEYSHDEKAMCVKVSANDGLYLVEDFVVTHNTGLVAIVQQWFMSTRRDAKIVVTANTATQLSDKTWRELKIWHDMLITRSWFTWTATKYYQKDHPGTWLSSAIPWSKDNPDAFQGTHSQHVMLILDEASGIPYEIVEVAAGVMTTPGAIMLLYGNGVHASGPFFDSQNSLKHRYGTRNVDSREVTITNKQEIENEIEDFGIESDRVKVRWLGQFPSKSSNQLISEGLVRESVKLNHAPDVYIGYPVIVGVDVARGGADRSAIAVRQGLKTHSIKKYRELNTMELVDKIVVEVKLWHADAIMVDVVGIGAGVVDRLRQLGYDVFEVNAGNVAADSAKYYHKRTEMWDATREWLEAGGQIVDDTDLKKELVMPEVHFTEKPIKMMLETKEKMKARLGPNTPSPDVAEALVYTFAYPVENKMRGDGDYEDDYSRQEQANSVTGY